MIIDTTDYIKMKEYIAHLEDKVEELKNKLEKQGNSTIVIIGNKDKEVINRILEEYYK